MSSGLIVCLLFLRLTGKGRELRTMVLEGVGMGEFGGVRENRR